MSQGSSDFDSQPELVSDTLRLRPLRIDDFEALYVVASDPLIWEQHPQKDRHRREVFQRFFDDAMASGGALLAEDVVTAEAIGSSRYHGYNPARSEVEIGWTFLAKDRWGGEWNREMKRLMLKHAFEQVEAVLLIIGADNLRSQKAASKIGARLVDDNLQRGGKRNVVYRLTESDFYRALSHETQEDDKSAF